ncbi:Ectin [Halotydeus destructor]|nr:Ectin [Halotydeus destructor]
MKLLLVSLLASAILVLATADQSRPPMVQGQGLRLVELHETTTWPFLEDCHNGHNGYRQLHGVPELKLNRTLVDYARLKALILAWYDGEPPAEKDGPMFGENDYWVKSDSPTKCTDAVAQWYSEGSTWDYDESQMDDTNRHFAQVVWRRTRRFGCGQALSRGPRGGVYTVCFYDRTAEAGQERTNVLRPKSMTTTAAPEPTTEAAQEPAQESA